MKKTLCLAGVAVSLAGCGYHAHVGSVHNHLNGEVHAEELEAQLAASRVNITVKDGFRYIEANGLANHETGQFPNRGNPNAIAPQNYSFRVPLEPMPSVAGIPLLRQPFGVAVNGVVFDPGTAEFWRNDPSSGWNYEALSGAINLGVDFANAHVQPSGAYHYHGIPYTLLEKLGGRRSFTLLGWAADGYPIYGPYCPSDPMNLDSELKELKSSFRVRQGQRESGPGGVYDGTFVQDYEYVHGSGDLDEFNGRFGKTPESPKGTFYYVLTEQFPFVPRLFKGSPDPSFARRRPQGPPRGGFRPVPPPPPPGRRPGA